MVRSKIQADGKALGALDMLIAAHALETRSVLVTNDQAFKKIVGLKVEDWTV